MQLNELLSGVVVLMRPQEEIEITSIAFDSRKVEKGSLFCCIPVSYTHLGVVRSSKLCAKAQPALRREKDPKGSFFCTKKGKAGGARWRPVEGNFSKKANKRSSNPYFG